MEPGVLANSVNALTGVSGTWKHYKSIPGTLAATARREISDFCKRHRGSESEVPSIFEGLIAKLNGLSEEEREGGQKYLVHALERVTTAFEVLRAEGRVQANASIGLRNGVTGSAIGSTLDLLGHFLKEQVPEGEVDRFGRFLFGLSGPAELLKQARQEQLESIFSGRSGGFSVGDGLNISLPHCLSSIRGILEYFNLKDTQEKKLASLAGVLLTKIQDFRGFDVPDAKALSPKELGWVDARRKNQLDIAVLDFFRGREVLRLGTQGEERDQRLPLTFNEDRAMTRIAREIHRGRFHIGKDPSVGYFEFEPVFFCLNTEAHIALYTRILEVGVQRFNKILEDRDPQGGSGTEAQSTKLHFEVIPGTCYGQAKFRLHASKKAVRELKKHIKSMANATKRPTTA